MSKHSFTTKGVSVARFSLDAGTENGDFVTREGKVFELGEWKDKGFALSEAEADAAIAAFTPAENDLDHRSTILDGHLGTLESVKRVGSDLIGRVKIPKWLDALQGDKPIGVSLAWDRAKRIVGNALTLNPRISDAHVAAAFTADNDFEAQDAFDFFVEFAGRRNSKKDASDLQAVHDLTLNLGAECKQPSAADLKDVIANYTARKEKPRMKVRDLLAMFGIGDKPDLDADVTPTVAPAQVATVTAPVNTFSAENDAMKAELKATRETSLTAAAATFCADLRTARKIIPAQEKAIAAAFCQAARDDAKGQAGYIDGLACFTAEGKVFEGERVKTLRGQYETAPVLNYTQEMLEGTEQSILFAGGEAPMTPAELASYLGKSELGRAALAEAGKK